MKIWRGFKEFMSEGNALEMAVAFVLGAAFTMLVTSLTDNLIKPIVGLLLGGGVDAGVITIDGQTIDITAMINAAITFLITAVVIYVVFVHPMNAIRERRHRGEAPKLNSEDYLREIRDLLVAQSQGGSADQPGPSNPDGGGAGPSAG